MVQKKKSKKTKKVGVAGRFGSRYGRKIRENVRKVEVKSKAKHDCPQCGKLSLKRVSNGIWQCTKCKTKLAGGAYVPQTGLGKISLRAVQGATKEELIAAIDVEDKADEEKEKAKAKPASKKPKKAKKAKAPKAEAAEESPAEEQDTPTEGSPTGDPSSSSGKEDAPVEEEEAK
ncbi:50S ribosomal protein L37ae [archaeon]